ncbi:lipoprotein-releasing ABC transporter permease subunit LolE [Frischella sp. Ac48]|uniref:lipoprotein-releasing ABC transporter permease subunit LolE n=1 Tax=Frischella sp. Ac48 TaxID=2804531 RepID=UPI001C7DE1BA|nr:lipoprotein-releasing ABC transporter permease subunit LolE [Frischella sp. Ac48]MBX4133590.1 lipoprotein-releasing ABC transporter permease subunit LolE [Frischella sp. Ac48]
MLALVLAKRFRKGRKQSAMLSLISVISTASIAIGIAALIIGLSAMNGFERELHNRVLSVIPHGEFFAANGRLTNWRTVQQQIDQNPEIISSAPFIRFTGLLENGNKLKAVQVQGIDLEQEAQTSRLPKYILANRWQEFKPNSKQILIGIGLAQSLAVKEGEWITLMIPSSDSAGQLKQPRRIRLQVVGIMNFSGSLGNELALLPLIDAQKYLQIGDTVTGIQVNVKDIYQANYVINRIKLNLYQPILTSSWERSYGYMYHDIQMIRQIMYLAMIIVISVACFSIVSTLVIAVKDKQREIAILKTLGANNRLISQTFICYGVISGLIGSLVGVVLGVSISSQLSQIVKGVEVLLGHSLLNSHIYFIDFLPSEIHLSDVIIVFFTSLLLTLIASYYPARRACNVDPVKILNGY